jgi:hypothetical protein
MNIVEALSLSLYPCSSIRKNIERIDTSKNISNSKRFVDNTANIRVTEESEKKPENNPQLIFSKYLAENIKVSIDTTITETKKG